MASLRRKTPVRPQTSVPVDENKLLLQSLTDQLKSIPPTITETRRVGTGFGTRTRTVQVPNPQYADLQARINDLQARIQQAAAPVPERQVATESVEQAVESKPAGIESLVAPEEPARTGPRISQGQWSDLRQSEEFLPTVQEEPKQVVEATPTASLPFGPLTMERPSSSDFMGPVAPADVATRAPTLLGLPSLPISKAEATPSFLVEPLTMKAPSSSDFVGPRAPEGISDRPSTLLGLPSLPTASAEPAPPSLDLEALKKQLEGVGDLSGGVSFAPAPLLPEMPLVPGVGALSDVNAPVDPVFAEAQANAMENLTEEQNARFSRGSLDPVGQKIYDQLLQQREKLVQTIGEEEANKLYTNASGLTQNEAIAMMASELRDTGITDIYKVKKETGIEQVPIRYGTVAGAVGEGESDREGYYYQDPRTKQIVEVSPNQIKDFQPNNISASGYIELPKTSYINTETGEPLKTSVGRAEWGDDSGLLSDMNVAKRTFTGTGIQFTPDGVPLYYSTGFKNPSSWVQFRDTVRSLAPLAVAFIPGIGQAFTAAASSILGAGASQAAVGALSKGLASAVAGTIATGDLEKGILSGLASGAIGYGLGAAQGLTNVAYVPEVSASQLEAIGTGPLNYGTSAMSPDAVAAALAGAASDPYIAEEISNILTDAPKDVLAKLPEVLSDPTLAVVTDTTKLGEIYPELADVIETGGPTNVSVGDQDTFDITDVLPTDKPATNLNELLDQSALSDLGIPAEPAVTEPAVTEPPVTEPPVTEPTVTEPPVTEPTVIEPPVIEPPVIEPPVIEPPVIEPPVIEPPVGGPTLEDELLLGTEPPVIEPPVGGPTLEDELLLGTEPPVIEPPVGEPTLEDELLLGTEPPVIEPPVGEPTLEDELLLGTEPPVIEPPVGEPTLEDELLLGTEPPVIEPPVGEPAVTEPAVTEPAVGEPAVGEPAVGEPAVGEPAVGEPAVSGPAVSGPTLEDGVQWPFDENLSVDTDTAKSFPVEQEVSDLQIKSTPTVPSDIGPVFEDPTSASSGTLSYDDFLRGAGTYDPLNDPEIKKLFGLFTESSTPPADLDFLDTVSPGQVAAVESGLLPGEAGIGQILANAGPDLGFLDSVSSGQLAAADSGLLPGEAGIQQILGNAKPDLGFLDSVSSGQVAGANAGLLPGEAGVDKILSNAGVGVGPDNFLGEPTLEELAQLGQSTSTVPTFDAASAAETQLQPPGGSGGTFDAASAAETQLQPPGGSGGTFDAASAAETQLQPPGGSGGTFDAASAAETQIELPGAGAGIGAVAALQAFAATPLGKLALSLGGSALLNKMFAEQQGGGGAGGPLGWSGEIPKYTAVRERVPFSDTQRRPGEYGRRYFSDTAYVPMTTGEGSAETNLANIAAAKALAQQQAQGLASIPTRAARPVYTPKYMTNPAAAEATGEFLPIPTYEKEPRLKFAAGGLMGLARGRYLNGTTDGMEDKLRTTIDGEQPAALSHGEFVIPADVVSHLGNGNSQAGAKRLYEMMDRIRQARTGTKKQGKQINANKYLPV